RALHGAEKTYGDPDRLRYFSQGKLAASPQLPQMGANRTCAAHSGGTNFSLALKQLDDGGGVESAHFAQEARALQQFHVLGGVEAVLAFGSPRARQAKAFPGANHGGRNPDLPRHISDFQVRFGHMDLRLCRRKGCAARTGRNAGIFSADSSPAVSLTLRD